MVDLTLFLTNKMKRFFASLILIAAVLCATAARAQTFGSGTIISNTTSVLLQKDSQVFTNYAYVTMPAKPVILSNITSTNETVILSYGFIVQGQNISNAIYIASITNSFVNGTNGGTWTTNIPAQTLTVTLLPTAQAAIGLNTNNIYVP